MNFLEYLTITGNYDYYFGSRSQGASLATVNQDFFIDLFIAGLTIGLVLTIRHWWKHKESRTPYRTAQAFRALLWLVMILTLLAARECD